MKRRKLLTKTSRHFWHWRRESGQSMIEYLILFAVIAAVTFIGTAVFFQRVCRSQHGGGSVFQNYFDEIVYEVM